MVMIRGKEQGKDTRRVKTGPGEPRWGKIKVTLIHREDIEHSRRHLRETPSSAAGITSRATVSAEGLDGACRYRGHYGGHSCRREMPERLRGLWRGERWGVYHTVVPGLRNPVEVLEPVKLPRAKSESEYGMVVEE